MVITAVLYTPWRPGTATSLHPREAPPLQAQGKVPARYRAAAGEPARGVLEGVVRHRGRPVPALLFAVQPPSGQPLPAPSSRELAVRGSAYATPLAVAYLGDRVTARNDDAVLHTVRLSLDGHLESARPLPPNAGGVQVPLPRAGLYRLSCANHRFGGRVAAGAGPPVPGPGRGRRPLRMDPAARGEVTLAAIALRPDGLWRSEVPVAAGAGAARQVEIALEAGHTVAMSERSQLRETVQ